MKELTKLIQQHFDQHMSGHSLFRVHVTGDILWDIYLSSFNKKDNPVFRDPESSYYNCNHCKNWIRRYGNIVAINSDLDIISLFDLRIDSVPEQYKSSVTAMAKEIRVSSIKSIFTETFDDLNSLPYESCKKNQEVFKLGVGSNTKIYNQEEANKYPLAGIKKGDIKEFNHFNLYIPSQYVNKSGNSIATLTDAAQSNYDVFKRGMKEISLSTLQLVKELILQDSILNGKTYIKKIDTIIKYKKNYISLTSTREREAWLWLNSWNNPIAKFRNSLIGVLCVELTEGEDLTKACLNWNKRVDPANYKKAKAPFTKKQKEEAEKFVTENGYLESFQRRHATLDDIDVTEIIHTNVDNDTVVKQASIFDRLTPVKSTQHKRQEFKGVLEVSLDNFMKNILPTVTSLEVYLEPRLRSNMMNLTTAVNPDSKPMFSWNNNFSQTFIGNLAGKSELAEMVEAKGGRTDGAFRFTHSWNKLERNQSLMDLHVFMPGCTIPRQYTGGPNVSGRRVGWSKRQDSLSGGKQDVDYTSVAPSGYIPVENITFPELSKMPEGTYKCMIHNWSFRTTGGKGEAEIAFQGQTYQYVYPATKNHEWVNIADVTLKNGTFTIKHHLPVIIDTKEIYGLEPNQFHKVNLMCYSPNHWGNSNVGHKHLLLMLQGAKTDELIRSFHSQDLNSELYPHRRVLDALGYQTMIEPSNKQLAGLGFNTTVRDYVYLKVSGSHKRMIKLIF
jgi:hypothetical protein